MNFNTELKFPEKGKELIRRLSEVATEYLSNNKDIPPEEKAYFVQESGAHLIAANTASIILLLKDLEKDVETKGMQQKAIDAILAITMSGIKQRVLDMLKDPFVGMEVNENLLKKLQKKGGK